MLRLLAALLPLCVLAFSSPAVAATYYVSPSGSNSRSGASPAEAWQSTARVNQQNFAPGDQILFEGGKVFSGGINLDRNDAGTAASPVVIGSYGSGRSTIAAGNGRAISVYNAAGFRISNLVLVGSGYDVNTESGILVYADLPGDVLLDSIAIDNVEARGFGDYGVEIGAWANRTGFANVRITRVVAHDNGAGGIFTYAMVRAVHRNVYVGHSQAYLNPGFAGRAFNTGNGITLSGVDGGTIEYSVAHDNGWRCDAGNGPVGIWTFSSNNVVLQYNESHHNKTGGGKDGGGFHLDNSTSNSVMQYNYSHDNAGSGYMLAHRDNDYIHSGNVIRWNLSEDDARRNNYAAIHLWGRIRNAQIYNNTVYLTAGNPSSAGALHARNNTIETQDLENVTISNNLLQTTGGVALVSFTSQVLDGATGVRLQGNAYWPGSGAFRIQWRGATYSSLDAFRSATGQERVNGQNVGIAADPTLEAPGSGPDLNDATMIGGVWQYRLQPTSRLIDAGVDLAAQGVNVGERDYFGGPSRHGPPDIGAHEFYVSCNWTPTPANITVPAAGGTGTIDVWAASADCGWNAAPDASWVTVNPRSDSGSGSIAYAVAANTGAAARTSRIRIASAIVTLSQTGTGTTPPPPGDTGAWSHGDVGSPGLAGNASGSGSSFTVEGGGADIWGTADAFHLVQQQVTGDWEIEALVSSVENVNAWTKAGLMIRESLSAGSKHASIFVTPGKGVWLQYRATTGGTSGAIATGTGVAPQWVRLRRAGSTFTAYRRATDGSWNQVATTTIAMASTIYIGLVVSSHDTSQLATVRFDNVAARELVTPPPPPPDTSGWMHSDVGGPALAGSASGGGSSFTVDGAGADIWGTGDQFHFMHQQVSGDFEIEALVSSVENVNVWTKAGLMVRETLSAGSRHASIFVTPGKGVSVQYRATTNDVSGAIAAGTGTAPQWIRIRRTGSTFTFFRRNADATWSQVATTTIALASNVYVGLAVSSHDTTQLATARFDNVTRR